MRAELQKIVDEFAAARCGSDKWVAEYAPRAIYAVAHGMIEVAENVGVHGEFGSYKVFEIGVKVGGNVPRDVHNAIRDKVKALVGAGFEATYGTAWSFYGKRR